MCLLREESSNVCEVLLVGRHWNGRMSEVQEVKIVKMKNKSLKQNGSKQICLRDIGCCRVKWAPVTTAWHRDKWVPVTTAWRVLRCQMEERPADVEGSYEYIE
jgi:hypothetical protein